MQPRQIGGPLDWESACLLNNLEAKYYFFGGGSGGGRGQKGAGSQASSADLKSFSRICCCLGFALLCLELESSGVGKGGYCTQFVRSSAIPAAWRQA